MDPDKASATISESSYGIHCLIIYFDLNTLRRFYALYIKKQIEEENEIIQFATFYETEDSVRQILSKDPMNLDVIRWEKTEQALTIMDSSRWFAPNTDYYKQIDNTLLKNANSKQKEGVSVISDYGYFLFNNFFQNLLEYELNLPIKSESNSRTICLYNQKDFEKMSKEQKLRLIEHHTITIKI